MTYMQLLTGYGPYYIIGFVVTFFTLMSSRYMLGMNIYPQERIVRVMMMSIFWLPALIICTILTYVKRSDKLDAANSEAEELRRQLAEANQLIDSAASEELKPKQEFTEEIQETKEQPAPEKPKKKGILSW